MKDAFRTLDLNLLRVFAALMAEGHVTRAAGRLALSQPAVSNALARLRLALGDPLFDKAPGGVRPTPRARELWQQIQPHFDAMRQAISPDRFDAHTHRGTFTLAMSDYTAERVMPRLVSHLAEEAPGLRIDLVPYSITHLGQLLDREGVDMAVGAYLNDTSRIAGMRTSALWPIHAACVMRRDHPLARGRIGLKAFLAARHVDIRLPGMHEPLYDSLLAGHGLQRNLVATLHSYEQALAVIHQGGCIGVLPATLLDTSPVADELMVREPPIPMPTRPLGLIWHQRRDADAAHRWLREVMVSLFSVPVD